jgi:hypothetical protein
MVRALDATFSEDCSPILLLKPVEALVDYFRLKVWIFSSESLSTDFVMRMLVVEDTESSDRSSSVFCSFVYADRGLLVFLYRDRPLSPILALPEPW